MINYIDNFLTEQEHKKVYEFCTKAKWTYGELDYPGRPPTGMGSTIDGNEWVYKLMMRRTLETFEFLQNRRMYRMHMNIFAPGEWAYYHVDREDGYTVLYYPNLEWKLDDGGATEFCVDDQMSGLYPVPNRVVVFDSSIWHRATSFRDRHRFSLALKFE